MLEILNTAKLVFNLHVRIGYMYKDNQRVNIDINVYLLLIITTCTVYNKYMLIWENNNVEVACK